MPETSKGIPVTKPAEVAPTAPLDAAKPEDQASSNLPSTVVDEVIATTVVEPEIEEDKYVVPSGTTFNDALLAFRKSNALSRAWARYCAEHSLMHFSQHGDVTYIQRFHDALTRNWNRRNAYVSWLVEFSPIAYDNGKFSKDKRENAKPFNLTGALKEPFWDFKPEKEYGEMTLLGVFEMLFKSLDKAEKHKITEETKTSVARLRTVLTKQMAGIGNTQPQPMQAGASVH